MFRPAGDSSSEDSDSCYEPSPVSLAKEEEREKEGLARSLLFDLSSAVEAGDLDTVRDLLESVPVNTLLNVWSCGEVTAAGLAALHCQELGWISLPSILDIFYLYSGIT